MLSRFAKFIVVAALAVSLGLHWVLLQSIAWTSMVATYSQTMPLREAVARTFDGKHPCNLCALVREGQRSEKQKEAQGPLLKLDLVCAPSKSFFPPPLATLGFPVSLHVPTDSSLPPPVPPPRAA